MYTTARIAAIRAEAAAHGDIPSWGWHALPTAMVTLVLGGLFLAPLPQDADTAAAQAFGPVIGLSHPAINASAEPGEGEAAISPADLPQGY